MHSRNRENHFDKLKLIFEKCCLYCLCLNPDECVFMVQQGKVLGHVVSKNGISIDYEKIKIIVELPRPRNPKQVQEFMGHCGYYRWFIYMYAMIAKPLYDLLVVFIWTNEREASFHKLKTALSTTPILKAPNWDLIFHVHVDASNFAIGAILA